VSAHISSPQNLKFWDKIKNFVIYSLESYSDDQFQEETNCMCSKHGGDEVNHLEGRGVVERIILKWILGQGGGSVQTGLLWHKKGLHCTLLPVENKVMNFLDS
jgi:hypothetical protein